MKKIYIAKARRGRMRKNLDVVLAKADIVLVQETKLQNATYYERYKRKWHVFHNPCKINVADDGTVSYAAGTDVFVRRDFAKNFRVEHVVALSSYIQYVTFRPKEESSADFPRFNRSFAVINVYISNETRAEMLHALARLSTVQHGCDYCIAGGDWNTVPDESYTVWGNTSPSAVLVAQKNALAQLGLSEVVSETMTKISEHKQPQISRLDRFYVSHSVTEQKVMRPSIWLPPIPMSPGQWTQRGKKTPLVTTSRSFWRLLRTIMLARKARSPPGWSSFLCLGKGLWLPGMTELPRPTRTLGGN